MIAGNEQGATIRYSSPIINIQIGRPERAWVNDKSLVTIDMHYRYESLNETVVVGTAPIHMIVQTGRDAVVVLAWDPVIEQYCNCGQLTLANITQHGQLRRLLDTIVSHMLDGKHLANLFL